VPQLNSITFISLDSDKVNEKDLGSYFSQAKFIDWVPAIDSPAPPNWKWEFWDSFGCGSFLCCNLLIEKLINRVY
jgi:hypothetical protein